MTPEARVSAAIEVLDTLNNGAAAEQTLTSWARRNRFAGSSDRAAIRDLVFDALRCKRSFAWRSGSETGRGLMVGALHAAGTPLDALFTGQGYGPAPPTASERIARAISDAPDPVRLDCPDALWPELQRSLGPDTEAILSRMQHRAPVFLRHNAAKTTRDAAISALAADGITASPHPLSPTAIEVTGNPRKVRGGQAFQTGLVELQDAASQAVTDAFRDACRPGRVLDYCAGGGGKSLALAASGAFAVYAHDRDPGRMVDLPARAARAGADITLMPEPKGLFDGVLCDVPCSGSGAWRRQPEAKWTLTPERLKDLNDTQDSILDKAAEHVMPDGVLAYATCSLLRSENADRIDSFLERNADWTELFQKNFTPLDGADGFFITGLKRRV